MHPESGDPAIEGEWTPPLEFDGFEVIRPLGRGGMGHVYLGRDPMLDRPVALKFIAGAEPATAARDRFLLEARAIARMQHPNVVGIFRIGAVGRRPYIAYEFIAGLSLDQMAKPLPWQRALAIGVGVARGLAEAHRRDVLHRDIKPGNIMLAEGGEVKLLDFGVAKIVVAGAAPDRRPRVAAERAAARATSDTVALDDRTLPSAGEATPVSGQSLTATGALLGTPLYMAPELWTGEPASARSDLYGLGLVLYELCAGSLPFQHLDAPTLAEAALSRDMPPLASVCPAAPAAFAEIVDRCVRRWPEERFQTADDLHEALASIHAIYEPFAKQGDSELPASDGDALRVASSYARLSPRADLLAERVYAKLFEAHPNIRPLFPPEMGEQRTKLMGALKAVVENLRKPERVLPLLEDLGRRHAAYGVEPEHFEAVGTALLAALTELEGDAWTDENARAWRNAYGQIADAMKRGLTQETATPDPARNAG